jgi:tetraacyldisaccharide 4'-kinase
MTGPRGLAGWFEESWSGTSGPGWTAALAPLSAAYGAAASLARRRAVAGRVAVQGVHVVAVGGLTVGGAGKSSVARWIALESIGQGRRTAILLRGHGARRRVRGTYVVPDFEGYPLAEAAERAGDEAAAHRAALPRGLACVAVDPDRRRAAGACRSGYGATVAVLDDGWEQGSLRWDELWVVLDPARPVGNGFLLPAGPLRRLPQALEEADVVAFALEREQDAVSEETLAWVRGHAPRARIARFRRVLEGVSPLGGRAVGAWSGGSEPVALVSAVGAPERLERFARGAGIDVRYHAAFPDHARFDGRLAAEAARAAAAGAKRILITEKDEFRWPSDFACPLPVGVLRTALRPVDLPRGAPGDGGHAVATAGTIG